MKQCNFKLTNSRERDLFELTSSSSFADISASTYLLQKGRRGHHCIDIIFVSPYSKKQLAKSRIISIGLVCTSYFYTTGLLSEVFRNQEYPNFYYLIAGKFNFRNMQSTWQKLHIQHAYFFWETRYKSYEVGACVPDHPAATSPHHRLPRLNRSQFGSLGSCWWISISSILRTDRCKHIPDIVSMHSSEHGFWRKFDHNHHRPR